MKKYLAVLLAAVLLISAFVSCTPAKEREDKTDISDEYIVLDTCDSTVGWDIRGDFSQKT